MEEASDNAMVNDSDGGSSDIIIHGHANQPNEQAEKINLLDMPREILEHILIKLDDDKDLLTASHVCKLFASSAETTFARKYSDECYYIIVDHDDQLQKPFYKVMLTKYGAHMRSIAVTEADEGILDLIEQNCLSLEAVELLGVPRMIHSKDLKEVSLYGVGDLSRKTFAEFIGRNQQLEALDLNDTNLNLIDLLDGQLNSLETLEYGCRRFITNLPKIRLNSLESLTLRSSQKKAYVRLLQVLECKQLKELDLADYSGPDVNDEVTNAIGKFDTLASLRLANFQSKWQITLNQLEKLAVQLPCLTELTIRSAESNQFLNSILSVLSVFPKLTQLTMHVDGEYSLDQFADDVKKSINEFHGRFADTNTEVKIVNDERTVFTSKDCVIMLKNRFLELHWMTKLTVEKLREAMAVILYNTSDLKFINHCAEHALDICAFTTVYGRLECLDIKSDGPIIFKENSSRHHNFFPCLKILKLHLDERNAIDFLGKLDSIFCERIEELWLDTEGGASRSLELEHIHDMTNILAKFENLTSLNLAPAFTHFDPKHLLSVCQNLNDLHIIR